MKATEAIRKIMEAQGVRFTALAGRLGIKNNILAGRLAQDNISIDKMNEMLRALDYKIVVLPRESRIPDGGIEIE